MIIDREWIAGHIPHQGAMLLIDRVDDWDDVRIRAVATGLGTTDNPLRSQGQLHVACGIEYAAQAMAIHGALCNQGAGKPRIGFLASVRAVEMEAERLDDVDAPLDIVAERLGGDANNVIYQFELAASGRRLMRGRATVILDAADLLEGRP